MMKTQKNTTVSPTVTPSVLPMVISCPASASGMEHRDTSGAAPQQSQDISYDPTDTTAAGALTHRIAAEIIAERQNHRRDLQAAAQAVSQRYPDLRQTVIRTALWYASEIVRDMEETARRSLGHLTGGIETLIETPWQTVSRGIVDAWTYDQRNAVLTIHELKTGPQDASEYGLIQCRIYALSMAYSMHVVPSEVRLHVWQDYSDTHEEITWKDLQAWEQTVLIPALSRAGSDDYRPSERACRYCPMHPRCTACILHALRTADEIVGRYSDLTDVPDEEMVVLMSVRARCASAMELIKAETDRRFQSGSSLPGITETTPCRQILKRDEAAVLHTLSLELGMTEGAVRHEITKNSPLTVSGIDRLTGSPARTQQVLGDLVSVRRSGRYTLQE